MSNVVKQGQCFLDKVIQLTGNYELSLDVAIQNNLSITAIIGDDDYLVGSAIEYNKIVNKQVVDFLSQNWEPATNISAELLQEIGIGNMIIGTTFSIE